MTNAEKAAKLLRVADEVSKGARSFGMLDDEISLVGRALRERPERDGDWVRWPFWWHLKTCVTSEGRHQRVMLCCMAAAIYASASGGARP